MLLPHDGENSDCVEYLIEYEIYMILLFFHGFKLSEVLIFG
jgi:hypothetical protein